MSRRMRTTGVVLTTVALVGAAFLVRLTQPSDEDQQKPFVTTAVFDQQVEGRDLTFEAHDAYLADRIISPDWVGDSEGVWLIIDATIGAKLGIATPYATLTMGGLRFTTSKRAEDVGLGGSLNAGLPQEGSFVFELPRELVEGAAGRDVVVRFATAFQVRLDSAIDMTLDLSTLRSERSVTIEPAGMVLP
jgi:hypothetical protein